MAPRGRPTKLTNTITLPDGRTQTTAEAIIERLRTGAYRAEAARSVGVTYSHMNQWCYEGAKARLAENHRPLTRNEKLFRDFLNGVEEAEAQAIFTDWTRLGRMAAGGAERVVITEKVERVEDPEHKGRFVERLVERTTRTERTLPDVRALIWRLEHRWPQKFGPQVQVHVDGEIDHTVLDTKDRARALAAEIKDYLSAIETGAVELPRAVLDVPPIDDLLEENGNDFEEDDIIIIDD